MLAPGVLGPLVGLPYEMKLKEWWNGCVYHWEKTRVEWGCGMGCETVRGVWEGSGSGSGWLGISMESDWLKKRGGMGHVIVRVWKGV